MSYLNSNDWLVVTLDNPLSTDAEIRLALRKLRQMAKGKPEIGPNFVQALQAYARTHNGQNPTAVDDLRPYLQPALPDEILDRYRVISPGEVPDPNSAPRFRFTGSGRPLLEEKGPVDENYDSLLLFMEQGGWTIYGTSKMGDAIGKAWGAYRKAHDNRDPETADQILPYLGGTVDPVQFREYWAVREKW